MRAIVYKSTGSWYIVKNELGQVFNARIKGKFKIDNITSTNPIAVGDVVNIENEEDIESTVITAIEERRNYINRTSPHNKNQHHIVASNLDQTLLIATIKDPKTSTGFIDRFLITAEAYRVPAIIVFNKIDLLKSKDLEKLEEVKKRYEDIGYKVLAVSIKENKGLDEIKEILKNKTTLLSGHSGVGKSTFINHLFPEYNLRTKDVSDWSGKGMHTTTFAEMFDLKDGGSIIDTPGIRELGLFDMDKRELAHYFPEMRAIMHDCQFNNCVHINEPGCAIKNAVELPHNSISMERYISYLAIFESIEDVSF
jgi:ribosome biogenesis GTPase / thiamine phosphate phosphatase